MSPPASLPDDYSGLELDFHTLANHISQLAWITHPDGIPYWFNKRWYDYTGLTINDLTETKWRSVMHQDHVDRITSGFKKSLETEEPWQDVYPIRRQDGQWNWFLNNAMPIRNQKGEVIRWLGTSTDVTEQKANEARQLMLMREVDHRAKNALAVAQAVVKLSRANTIEDYRTIVESRIASLSRAHMLLADSLWQGIDLRSIINGELNARSGSKNLIRISGETVKIDPSFGQSVALVFNELISNAERYGALARDNGCLSIHWKRTDTSMVVIDWKEHGLESLEAPRSYGFGSSLFDKIVRQQWHGDYERSWQPDGVFYRISLPAQILNS